MASKGATYELAVLLNYKDRLSAGLDQSIAKLKTLGAATERSKRSEVTATARAAREVERITAQTTRQAEQQYRFRERIATQSAARAATAQVREQRRSANETLRLIDKVRREEARPHGRPGGRGERWGSVGLAAGVATGVAGAAYLGKGYHDSTNKEAALANLRATITKVEPDGSVNKDILASQMAAFEALGTELGNKLPGNIMQYLDQATTLKQRGLPVEDILGGAGRAAGYLSASSRADPQETAREVATFGQIYGLKGKEYEQSTDLLSRIKTAKDLDAGELIEASKYFQGRVGTPLGLTGLEGANQSVKYLAFMRQATGTEGSQLGTSTSSLVRRLIAPPKEARTALAEVRKQTGIDLSPVDKKGKFIGLEALVEKFTKLEGKLTPAQLTGVANKIGGEEGSAAFTGMVEKGKGYRAFLEEINATISMMDKADITTGTTSAKMEALKGTYENFNAEMFESLTKGLDPVIDKTNIYLGQLQGIAAQHQNVAAFAAGVAGIGGAAVGATSGVIGLIDQLGMLGGGRGGGGGGGGIGGTGVGVSDLITGAWAGGKGIKAVGGAAARGGLGMLGKVPGPLGIAALIGALGYGLYNKDDKDTGESPAPHRYNKKISVDLFRQLSPEYKQPEGMKGLIRDTNERVKSGKITKSAGEQTIKIAEIAFPESYKTATSELAGVMEQVSSKAAPLGDTFVDLLKPTRTLPDAFGTASTAASRFADRVGSLHVGGWPVFGGQDSGGGSGPKPSMQTGAPGSRPGYDSSTGAQPTHSVGSRMISSVRAGGGVRIESINVNLPPGTTTGDPQELARMVGVAVRQEVAQFDFNQMIDDRTDFRTDNILERS